MKWNEVCVVKTQKQNLKENNLEKKFFLKYHSPEKYLSLSCYRTLFPISSDNIRGCGICTFVQIQDMDLIEV